MPRPGSIPADIVDLLRNRKTGATIEEIVEGLNDGRRRYPVPRHSVRSAIYQHLDAAGEHLFVRVARGRYALRR